LKITNERLRKSLHQALKSWKNLDFGKDQVLPKLVESMGYASISELLEKGIDDLSKINPLESHILFLRFKSDRTIISIAHELNFSSDQINRMQRKGITHLAQIYLKEGMVIKEAKANYLMHNLPTRDPAKLFGLDNAIDSIVNRVLSVDSPNIYTISGLGGIGKTSLADAVARIVLIRHSFADIHWIRYEKEIIDQSGINVLVNSLANEILPTEIDESIVEEALIQEFKSKTTLIIIDNLGSETNINLVIKKLSQISGKSKFFLTSRQHPSKDVQSFNYRISELSQEDSEKITVNQAENIGLGKHKQEIIENFDFIYSRVGGNPLALKLLVGLLEALPLGIILNEFKNTKLDDVISLYKHIYLLSWQSLNNKSKRLLLGMIQVSDNGITFDNMVKHSGLNEIETTKSLQSLFNRSLLEWRGGLEDRRYGIHQLTHTFLENDILNDADFRI
jgi:hypothetical protein